MRRYVSLHRLPIVIFPPHFLAKTAYRQQPVEHPDLPGQPRGAIDEHGERHQHGDPDAGVDCKVRDALA